MSTDHSSAPKKYRRRQPVPNYVESTSSDSEVNVVDDHESKYRKVSRNKVRINRKELNISPDSKKRSPVKGSSHDYTTMNKKNERSRKSVSQIDKNNLKYNERPRSSSSQSRSSSPSKSRKHSKTKRRRNARSESSNSTRSSTGHHKSKRKKCKSWEKILRKTSKNRDVGPLSPVLDIITAEESPGSLMPNPKALSKKAIILNRRMYELLHHDEIPSTSATNVIEKAQENNVDSSPAFASKDVVPHMITDCSSDSNSTILSMGQECVGNSVYRNPLNSFTNLTNTKSNCSCSSESLTDPSNPPVIDIANNGFSKEPSRNTELTGVAWTKFSINELKHERPLHWYPQPALPDGEFQNDPEMSELIEAEPDAGSGNGRFHRFSKSGGDSSPLISLHDSPLISPSHSPTTSDVSVCLSPKLKSIVLRVKPSSSQVISDNSISEHHEGVSSSEDTDL